MELAKTFYTELKNREILGSILHDELNCPQKFQQRVLSRSREKKRKGIGR